MSVSEQSTVNLDGTTRIEVAAGDSVNSAIRVNMVAGTVTISGADGAIQDGVDPLIRATVKDYPNSNPIAVVSVNTNGDPVSASGMTDAEFSAHLPLAIAEPVSVDDNGGSITVDGTFWQATQPISAAALPLPTNAATSALQTQPGVDIGDVTVNNAAGAASVNIQDGGNSITVDGTITANAGSNLNTSALALEAGGNLAAAVTALQIMDDWDETDRAKVNPIVGQVGVQGNTGTVTALTQRVVLATDVALPAGTNGIGKLTANSGVDIGDVDVLSIAAGTNRLGSVRLVDSADADLTSVIGTQTSRYLGVQNSTDAGRTEIRFYSVAAAAGTTGTETMLTLTRSSGTAATSTGTTFVLTNAKRLRIIHISVATRGHATATIQTTTFNFRLNTAGAVIVSSTPIILAARSATPATASAWDRYVLDLGEGVEILGNGTIQFGVSAAATYITNAPTWDVTIIGYEY